jgi:hypothetical protein
MRAGRVTRFGSGRPSRPAAAGSSGCLATLGGRLQARPELIGSGTAGPVKQRGTRGTGVPRAGSRAKPEASAGRAGRGGRPIGGDGPKLRGGRAPSCPERRSPTSRAVARHQRCFSPSLPDFFPVIAGFRRAFRGCWAAPGAASARAARGWGGLPRLRPNFPRPALGKSAREGYLARSQFPSNHTEVGAKPSFDTRIPHGRKRMRRQAGGPSGSPEGGPLAPSGHVLSETAGAVKGLVPRAA